MKFGLNCINVRQKMTQVVLNMYFWGRIDIIKLQGFIIGSSSGAKNSWEKSIIKAGLKIKILRNILYS